MKTYPFMQVDAFTKRPLSGNPCAIIFDADDLTDSQMQAIAQEMNLSETAFVLNSEIADVRARYFTPAEEIPLAGHPTIATIFALIETGWLALSGEKTRISLELQVGPIPVEVEGSQHNIKRITMFQKKPQFLATHDPEQIMPAFGLRAEDAYPNVPIQTVSTGTPQLMLAVKSLEVLKRIQMDIPKYDALRKASDFFSPHLFYPQGVTEKGDTFARHFGTPPDTAEDPFTGSATGGMAAFLWRYGLIDKPTFIAEQGHWMNRPGEAVVEVVGSADDIETVKVGGTAVTIIEGNLRLS